MTCTDPRQGSVTQVSYAQAAHMLKQSPVSCSIIHNTRVPVTPRYQDTVCKHSRSSLIGCSPFPWKRHHRRRCGQQIEVLHEPLIDVGKCLGCHGRTGGGDRSSPSMPIWGRLRSNSRNDYYCQAVSGNM